MSELDDIRRKYERTLTKAFGPALLMDGNTIDITAEIMDNPTYQAPTPFHMRDDHGLDEIRRSLINDDRPFMEHMGSLPVPEDNAIPLQRPAKPTEQAPVRIITDPIPPTNALEPMDNPTERAPMLSDDHVYGRPDARIARDFYEAKITSGELRVVKKVTPTRTFSDGRWWGFHSCCGRKFDKPVDGDYCPGCGAQIVKE